MNKKMIDTSRVKTKIISVVIIAVLTVAMVGVVFGSVTSNYVETGSINQYIYGSNNSYSSGIVETNGKNCSFFSYPTYGEVKKEGPYCLALDKKGLLWDSQVLGRDLNLYSHMANTTNSIYLGAASGDKLYFSVYSRNGSDGAEFYLTKFKGEARY